MKTPRFPSRKVVFLVRYFHLTLATVLLLSALLLDGCTAWSEARSAGVIWHAADAAPPNLLSRSLAENTNLPGVAVKHVLVAIVPTSAPGQQLYILNYNSPQLCGRVGCLYAAYRDAGRGQYERVWASYLHPELPLGQSLIGVSAADLKVPLPCLDVRQMVERGLQRLTYCFNGTRYQPTESTIFKLPVQS